MLKVTLLPRKVHNHSGKLSVITKQHPTTRAMLRKRSQHPCPVHLRARDQTATHDPLSMILSCAVSVAVLASARATESFVTRAHLTLSRHFMYVLSQNTTMALVLSSISAQAFSAPGSIGITGPFGFFDPLGLSKGLTVPEFALRREAELAHGRVAMVGALGFLVQEGFHPIFPAVNGPAINQLTQITKFSEGQSAFFAMSVAIAFAELNRARTGWIDPKDLVESGPRLQADYLPGDLGFDPLGMKPKDAASLLAMQNSARPAQALEPRRAELSRAHRPLPTHAACHATTHCLQRRSTTAASP